MTVSEIIGWAYKTFSFFIEKFEMTTTTIQNLTWDPVGKKIFSETTESFEIIFVWNIPLIGLCKMFVCVDGEIQDGCQCMP